jgi:hypothetical protein
VARKRRRALDRHATVHERRGRIVSAWPWKTAHPGDDIPALLGRAFGDIQTGAVIVIGHEVRRDDTDETIAVCDSLEKAEALAAALRHLLAAMQEADEELTTVGALLGRMGET